jgi:sporulation-control protein spo0M
MMTHEELLRKIFEHQLMLLGEIKSRLKEQMAGTLEEAFNANETFLKLMITQDNVDKENLQKLQNLWDNLTHEIDKTQKSLNQKADNFHAQKEMAKLYQH